ncbi:MAG: UDP-N-acetylmuramate dehydrogenase [Candidatus Omnitrophica bacterium]|nr:UDP-N-acetylmuramate dehydrogenase [Candidatus Omnitrophota bacterium]MDD5026895.1 UDP-N-acetylmuramate dehydrogenase [Candidatus Omnitrophota bacterium]MDD5662173.1 UDP-N-acetylmuramate dehydrogenase [Candidatus Omnitrophota bacterium]
MNWPKGSKIKVRQPLKGRTTFKIGGRAQFFSEPESLPELRSILESAKKNKIPVFILGAGSNLLISDKGVKGLVIKLNSAYFKKIALKGSCIEAGGGVTLNQAIKFAQTKSLAGLEFLAGIPGTLGGALAMNAGCWESAIGDLVKEVGVMDYSGRIKILGSKEIKFNYRKSSLGKYIILSALLGLKKNSRAQIQKNINKYLMFRRKSQDLSRPNAGSIFRNPPQRYAGKLIDLCGLKGKKAGQAFVSERHANFILNRGKASAKDVLGLMRIIQKKVKNKFKITLQPEIKIWA